MALADNSQTTTLQSNTALNLDTGATVASGGCILPAGSGSTLLQNNIYASLPATGLDIAVALGSRLHI